MSNIERRYAKLDEGVFPEEGEYGVTYLTLYSSGAGNVYDGWVYDPENKVHESPNARTYGYRNPDYPQYCWDDELIVDLSNAQSRQESSEFIQGRITSYNTNVSNRPIVLQDIDITGLTEEQRETKATTVLFSAIPLVQDAYIQAHIEVQCKVNISPDNTTGMVRVEAFYIINDESDRTMRPDPIHTFFVGVEDQRVTLPWIYFNAALRHEDHNYIGVKLLATGGTIEIGISDNPDYGDAMITLGSAGFTGDHIESGRPVYLEIFGREEVVAGYRLKPDDYTVLAHYDTGEIYEVTRICTFSPAMGTKLIDPITTLTAYYQNLSASMTVRLGLVESIELIGNEYIHDGSYTLDINDYMVLAYMDSGDIAEITEDCTFDPPMGTTLTSNTMLTATYEPNWMPGSSFTDSLMLRTARLVDRGSNVSNGLVYSLYDDNTIEITGNVYVYPGTGRREGIYIGRYTLPDTTLDDNISYTIIWKAHGSPGSIKFDGFSTITTGVKIHVIDFKGFENIDMSEVTEIYFEYQDRLTSAALNKINWSGFGSKVTSLVRVFASCTSLSNTNFCSEWDVSNVTDFMAMFHNSSINDLSGLRNWNLSSAERLQSMFMNCGISDFTPLSEWNLSNVNNIAGMFNGTYASSLSGLENWDVSNVTNIGSLFCYNYNLRDISAISGWDVSNVTHFNGMFSNDRQLEDISPLEHWDVSSGTMFTQMFRDCTRLRYVWPLRNWNIQANAHLGGMFGKTTEVTPFENTHLLDADTLNWTHGLEFNPQHQLNLRWNASSQHYYSVYDQNQLSFLYGTDIAINSRPWEWQYPLPSWYKVTTKINPTPP